jgi:hypothetical protein
MDYLINSHDSAIKIGELQTDLHKMMIGYKDKYKYSGDYKSYDRSIPSEILCASFELIKSCLNLNTYFSNLYEDLVSYILFGTLFHPRCGYINRERGIASGSFFTNVVDGLSNLIMLNYTNALFNIDPEMKICGDDNLLLLDDKLDTDKFSEEMERCFGVTNKFDPDHSSTPGSDYLGHFLGSK